MRAQFKKIIECTSRETLMNKGTQRFIKKNSAMELRAHDEKFFDRELCMWRKLIIIINKNMLKT